jgi:hypothetical protein
MKRVNASHGRIEEHGEGFGTADDELVGARAREIAITNGRLSADVNESDLEQARQELSQAQDDPTSTVEKEEFTSRDGPVGSPGRAAKTELATDEQTIAEDLVEEGVREATHEQMLEGNRQSRRADHHLDDQIADRT